MSELAIDPRLFYRARDGSLDGIAGMLADDSIAAGARNFISEEDEKCARFMMIPKEVRELTFSGMRIRQMPEDHIKLSHRDHIKNARMLAYAQSDSSLFAAQRGELPGSPAPHGRILHIMLLVLAK